LLEEIVGALSDALTPRNPLTGTAVIGPRSAVAGTGDEVIFPFGY